MKKYIIILSLLAFGFAERSLIAFPNIPVSSTTNQVLLTEDNIDQIYSVSINDEINVSLIGSETNNLLYSSGSGSQNGYRWEYDQNNKNSILSKLTEPDAIIHIQPPTRLMESLTKDTEYCWTFKPERLGFSTLTFKKYHYSNAKIRNADGSSPWKNPVEEIHFTINVVDPNEIDPNVSQ